MLFFLFVLLSTASAQTGPCSLYGGYAQECRNLWDRNPDPCIWSGSNNEGECFSANNPHGCDWYQFEMIDCVHDNCCWELAYDLAPGVTAPPSINVEDYSCYDCADYTPQPTSQPHETVIVGDFCYCSSSTASLAPSVSPTTKAPTKDGAKTKKSKTSGSGLGYGDCLCDKTYGQRSLTFMYLGVEDVTKIEWYYDGYTTDPTEIICTFYDISYGESNICDISQFDYNNDDNPDYTDFATNTYFTITKVNNDLCSGSFHTSCSKDIVGWVSENGCTELKCTAWEDANPNRVNNCNNNLEPCICDTSTTDPPKTTQATTAQTTTAATTGSGTTGSATTGSATTASATTGSATTGLATTASATTGSATTDSATTASGTTGSGTTGSATTGSGATGLTTTGSVTTGSVTTASGSTAAATTGSVTTASGTTSSATTSSGTTASGTTASGTTTAGTTGSGTTGSTTTASGTTTSGTTGSAATSSTTRGSTTTDSAATTGSKTTVSATISSSVATGSGTTRSGTTASGSTGLGTTASKTTESGTNTGPSSVECDANKKHRKRINFDILTYYGFDDYINFVVPLTTKSNAAIRKTIMKLFNNIWNDRWCYKIVIFTTSKSKTSGRRLLENMVSIKMEFDSNDYLEEDFFQSSYYDFDQFSQIFLSQFKSNDDTENIGDIDPESLNIEDVEVVDDDNNDNDNDKGDVGMVVGIIIGLFLFFCLLFVIIIYFWNKRNKMKEDKLDKQIMSNQEINQIVTSATSSPTEGNEKRKRKETEDGANPTEYSDEYYDDDGDVGDDADYIDTNKKEAEMADLNTNYAE